MESNRRTIKGVFEALKFGIQALSLGWIASGIVTQIISLFTEDSRYQFIGMTMVALGLFFVFMDYRTWKKEKVKNK